MVLELQSSTKMTSIDTYQVLDTWAPGSIAGFLWLLSLIGVVVGMLKCDNMPTFCVVVMQLFFPDMKAKKIDEVTVDETDLKPWAVFILALIVIPLTVSTMFLIFWSVYLVEEAVRGDCVPNFECFPMYHGNYLQTTPVDNCSQLFDLSDSNLTSMGNFTDIVNETDIGDEAVQIYYKCYRFVFRYVEGFTAVGGVLLFTSVISKLYFGILVAAYNMKSDKCCGILTIATWISAGVLCLLFIVINIAIRETVFQTTTDIILFIIYSVSFAAIVVCGVVVTCGLDTTNRDK